MSSTPKRPWYEEDAASLDPVKLKIAWEDATVQAEVEWDADPTVWQRPEEYPYGASLLQDAQEHFDADAQNPDLLHLVVQTFPDLSEEFLDLLEMKLFVMHAQRDRQSPQPVHLKDLYRHTEAHKVEQFRKMDEAIRAVTGWMLAKGQNPGMAADQISLVEKYREYRNDTAG